MEICSDKLRPNAPDLESRATVQQIEKMGYGSGGLSLHFAYSLQQNFRLPIQKRTASDIYEGDFAHLVLLSRGYTLLEMLRRTFVSRISNPISKTFIGYELEPLGRDIM